MLLSVFKSCGSFRTVLRTFRLNAYFSSTGGVAKNERNVWFLKITDMFKEKTVQQVENLKIVPEGYKLIYLSKDLRLIAAGRGAVFFLFVAGILFESKLYFNPESVVVRENYFKKEEVGYLLFIHAAVFYLIVTRHIHYIFRNGNSYKSVYYGLFGKLQQRIIDHEAKELIPPAVDSLLPFFHYLKGKPVVVSPSSFIHRSEYAALIKTHEPKK